MKRLIGLILLCALSLNVHAQEPLTFKGIPIDGNLSTFVEKVKNIGFKELLVSNHNAVVEGEFAGKQCRILIQASQTTDTVFSVGITLKEANKWDSLKYTYDEYKDLLTSKYGEGESFEHFTYPYDKEGLEMIALMNNKCTYATFFDLPISRIFIMISYVSGGGNVSVVYTNKKNQALAEKEKLNDL